MIDKSSHIIFGLLYLGMSITVWATLKMTNTKLNISIHTKHYDII